MLQFPTNGISRSIDKHNSKLEVFADWLEGCVLFSDDAISNTDVVDALCDNRIYDSQDFANEWVTTVWSEILRRHRNLGKGSPFQVSSNRISSLMSWKEVPAHSFCVLLSLVNNYSGLTSQWKKDFGAGYNEQGELFELLTMESLQKHFPDWVVYRTGWSKSSAKRLEEIVDNISIELGETKGDLKLWASQDANEAGLDLLWYRRFADRRVGIPLYLMQCASGENWKRKLHTPEMNVWRKVILFAATPKKAFATPFAIEETEFKRYCSLVDGPLFDRYRLLDHGQPSMLWLSSEVKTRIVDWVQVRSMTIPVFEQ